MANVLSTTLGLPDVVPRASATATLGTCRQSRGTREEPAANHCWSAFRRDGDVAGQAVYRLSLTTPHGADGQRRGHAEDSYSGDVYPPRAE